MLERTVAKQRGDGNEREAREGGCMRTTKAALEGLSLWNKNFSRKKLMFVLYQYVSRGSMICMRNNYEFY